MWCVFVVFFSSVWAVWWQLSAAARSFRLEALARHLVSFSFMFFVLFLWPMSTSFVSRL